MAETTVPQAHAPSLRDTWQDRIAEQARSGLSIKQFCKDRGIPEHCFYAWRRRLRPAVPVRFALVDRTVAGSATEQPALELFLASGERLRIFSGVDAATLRTVLAALRA